MYLKGVNENQGPTFREQDPYVKIKNTSPFKNNV